MTVQLTVLIKEKEKTNKQQKKNSVGVSHTEEFGCLSESMRSPIFQSLRKFETYMV